jgi:carbon monoxide dehydrogenase subunit G
MKLENEFSVNVPLERAWETLLDIQTVAGFLPGAKIEPTDEEGVFKGAMKIRVGPMSISYQGTSPRSTRRTAPSTSRSGPRRPRARARPRP